MFPNDDCVFMPVAMGGGGAGSGMYSDGERSFVIFQISVQMLMGCNPSISVYCWIQAVQQAV